MRKNQQMNSNTDETIADNAPIEDEKENSYMIIVRVLDHCLHDNESLVAIMHDVFICIKLVDNTMTNAYIRCDNAGWYHTGQTIL